MYVCVMLFSGKEERPRPIARAQSINDNRCQTAFWIILAASGALKKQSGLQVFVLPSQEIRSKLMKNVKVLTTLSSFVMHSRLVRYYSNWHMECCFMTNDDDGVFNILCASFISLEFLGKGERKRCRSNCFLARLWRSWSRVRDYGTWLICAVVIT